MRVDKDNFIEELKRKNPKALDYSIDIYGPLIKGIISKTLYSIGLIVISLLVTILNLKVG